MSKQILKIVGNFLVITDQDSGNEKDIPLGQCRAEYQGTQVFFITTSHTARDGKILSYEFSDLLDGENADAPFADMNEVKTWLRTKTGFKGAGTAAISTGDILYGGFADYNNGNGYQSILANTPTIMNNDSLGPFTTTEFLPQGITSLWSPGSSSFDWSELKAGDMIEVRLDVTAVNPSPNTNISVELTLGDGAGSYSIPFLTNGTIKNAGTERIIRISKIFMGDSNTLDNGGQFVVESDKDIDVKINGFYVVVLRKGI